MLLFLSIVVVSSVAEKLNEVPVVDLGLFEREPLRVARLVDETCRNFGFLWS